MKMSFASRAVLFSFLLSGLYSDSLRSVSDGSLYPAPTEGDKHKRERWVEMIHRSPSGIDWRAIELQNKLANLDRKKAIGHSMPGARVNFANGQLQGYWEEKGSDNVAGNVKAVDYNAFSNSLYLVADEGSLWKKNLSSGDWILLNQNVPLRDDILQVLDLPGGKERILASVGKDLWYSDDNGASFQTSNLVYPGNAPGNSLYSVVALNDAFQSVYCVANVLDPASGQYRTWLYRSTDRGVSFVKVHEFTTSGNLSLCNPHNSNELYVLDLKSSSGNFKLYGVQGNTVSTLFVSGGADIGAESFLFGTRVNGTTVLYAMTNSNKIYRSTNLGQTWIFKSDVPEGAWCYPEVSAQHTERLFFGGIHAYRSVDGGSSWTMLNPWSHYYGDEENKIHADVMAIQSFKRSDGSSFVIVNTHGGCYISNDDMQTNQNLSMKGLRTSQLYDVLTDPLQPGNIFLGTQDQGFQRTRSGADFGVVDFEQAIPGDFVNMTMTQSHLWVQYPGRIYYYSNPFATSSPPLWLIPGANLSGGGWSAPIEKVADPARNEILVGGGDLTGGPGAYLIRLTASETDPAVFSARQYNFNFRQQGGGSTGISAIETVPTDTSRIYVAMENGKFFYSTNAGTTWNLSVNQGPLNNTFGACILASRLTSDLVWFTGGGYASAPVVKSTDGGATFTSMSQGLPSTLVYEIVANETETLLFAATEAGPYVFSVADGQWYPMIGPDNPIQKYTGVEFLPAINTIRFSTYGRGVWDFKIATAPKVKVTTSGPVSICQGGSVKLTSLSSGDHQWYRNGQAIAGANQQFFVSTEPGDYSVSVTGAGGTQVSAIITVKVKPIPLAPVITADGNTSFCQGAFLTLRSNEPAGMKWYRNGSVDPQYKNDFYVVHETGVYNSKVVKDGCASSLSNSITATVTNLPVFPVITSATNTICEGSSIILTSSANEGLQWFRDGTAIPGATQPTYQATLPGSYTVSSTNICRSYTSTAKVLTLSPAPGKPAVTVSGSTSFCQGGSVKLTAPVANTYQWYLGGNPIPVTAGGTSMEFTAVNSGAYSVSVSNGGCVSPLSDAINITTNPVPGKPVITTDNNVLTSSSPDGNQWYLNGTAIAGATGQQFIPQSNGIYTVQVTRNSCTSFFSEGHHFVATSVIDLDGWNREVKLYPNPFTDKIFITNERNRRIELTVMDMQGKVISVHQTSNKNYFIPAESWVKGSYLVTVRDLHTKESRIYQVIKQ